MNKILRNVFQDFKGANKILNCEIQEMNLYKKINKLVCLFLSDEPIEIEDFAKFEAYIKQKFKIETIEIKIKYSCELNYDVVLNWSKLVQYMSTTYPLTRAILAKSKVSLENNILKVDIFVKSGADILETRRVNLLIENLIYNLTNKNIKVSFVDCVDKNYDINNKERMRQLEEMAILEMQEQARIEAEERAKNNIKNARKERS